MSTEPSRRSTYARSGIGQFFERDAENQSIGFGSSGGDVGYVTVNAVAGSTAIHATTPAYWNNSIDPMTLEETPAEPTRQKSAKPVQLKPEWYFKMLKKNFSILEARKLKKYYKTLEKAFEKASEVGQLGLAEKLLHAAIVATREAEIAAKGIQYYVEREDTLKYKQRLRIGHISDTRFEKYTRVIPSSVLKKKLKVEKVFDGFVIYHYWNDTAKDVKNMSMEEKAAMKDPILFGWIKETDRLYFVADWIDEFCELTFAELCKVVAKQTITIPTTIKV